MFRSEHPIPEITENSYSEPRPKKTQMVQVTQNFPVNSCSSPLINDNQILQYINNHIERTRLFKRNEHLVYRSDPQRYLYIVHAGCCKGYYIDASGREHISNFYYPGDIIGLESIFFRKFLINVIALETSHICYINLSKFLSLQQQSPEMKEQFIDIFSQQLWHAYSMHGTYNSKELVIQFLLDLSTHAKKQGQSGSELTLSMGRHDIGNHLGLSSETVSRVFTQLKIEKLIQVNRNFIKLCDIARLKQLAMNGDL